MNRPNIAQADADRYIKSAPDLITKSVMALEEKGIISLEEATDYIKKAIVPSIHPVHVLAIRGYYKKSMGDPETNDRGIYDDAFVLLAPNYIECFNANTDPRKYGNGIASLLPGLHYFKKGLHGFGRATPAYPAFRTDNATEQLPVIRDGEKGIKLGQYINIHRGGLYSTNSIACQTVQESEWLSFQQTTYNLMKKEGQITLPYLLIENN